MSIFTASQHEILAKIARNAAIKAKSLSSAVVAIATAGAAWWLGLSGAEQAAELAKHPVLVPYAPYIAGATWIVMALFPQWIRVSAGRATEMASLRAQLAAARQAIAATPTPRTGPADFAETQHVDLPLVPASPEPSPADPALNPSPEPRSRPTPTPVAPEDAVLASLAAVTRPNDPWAVAHQVWSNMTEQEILLMLATTRRVSNTRIHPDPKANNP